METMKTTEPKLPREGSRARYLVDTLRERNLTHGDAVDVYCSFPAGAPINRKHASMGVTRLLKKYGRKLGKAGGRGAWTFEGKPTVSVEPATTNREYQVGDRIMIKEDGFIPAMRGTIDARLISEKERPGFWGSSGVGHGRAIGGYWPVTIDEDDRPLWDPIWDPSGMYGAQGVDLVPLQEDETPAPEPLPPPPEIPVGALVRYVGPFEQDRGMVGRVVDPPAYVTAGYLWVLWLGTREFSSELQANLTVVKARSSGKPLDAAVGTVELSQFQEGDKVRYVGNDQLMRGWRGEVVKRLPRRRAGIRWETGLPGSPVPDTSEPDANLALDKSRQEPREEAPPALAAGAPVRCRKHGLTFPAKVFFGPDSLGNYKVVCPNGTYEWLARGDMDPLASDSELYQATPEKPTYGQTDVPSDQTGHLRELLEAAQEDLEGVRREQKRLEIHVARLEEEIRESEVRDRLDEWAKKVREGLTLPERVALRTALEES
jgi:hypothetical protein